MSKQHEHEEQSGGGYLRGLVTGVLLGAAAALLMAPKKGEEIRHDLSDSFAENAGRVREKAEDLKGKAEELKGDLSSRVTETAQELKERGQHLVESAKERGGSVLEHAQHEAGEFRAEAAEQIQSVKERVAAQTNVVAADVAESADKTEDQKHDVVESV